MALDEEKRLEHLRTYAWSWFSFHADQRTKMFNFFVASCAFLVAGYASAASNHSWTIAAVIGFLGVMNGIFFWRLDSRNEELVEYGKTALKEFERTLFEATWPPVVAAASPPGVAVDSHTPSAAPTPAPLLENPLRTKGISLADEARDFEESGQVQTTPTDPQNANALQPKLPFRKRLRRGKHGAILPLMELVLGVIGVLGFGFAVWHEALVWRHAEPARPSTEEVLAKLADLEKKTECANQLEHEALKEQARAYETHNDELASAIREVAAALRALQPTAATSPPQK